MIRNHKRVLLKINIVPNATLIHTELTSIYSAVDSYIRVRDDIQQLLHEQSYNSTFVTKSYKTLKYVTLV